MLSFPPGVLIGDGFASWGVIEKGGDYGHAETLHQLGLPFYIASIIGLLRLIKFSLIKIQTLNWEKNQRCSLFIFFRMHNIVFNPYNNSLHNMVSKVIIANIFYIHSYFFKIFTLKT